MANLVGVTKTIAHGLFRWIGFLSVILPLIALPVPSHANERLVLRIWVNSDKGYKGLQRIGDAYTAKTGIKVEVRQFDNAVVPFEEAMASGNGPDIWIWPHDRLGGWVQKKWIAPVSPGDAIRRDILQIAWDAFTIDNRVWGYPLSVEAVALIYNKALIPNPPRSFEEIVALQSRFKGSDVRVIGWETASPYFTWPLLAAGGGYVYERRIDGGYESKNTGINFSGAVQGAGYVVKLIEEGVIPKGGLSYKQAEADMLSGKQALWINGPWAWESLKAAKIDFGIAPLPSLGGKAAKPFVGVLGAMVTSTSQNRAVAVDFLENYVLKPAGLSTINADRPLGVPASRAMFWPLYGDPNIRASMEAIYSGKLMPNNVEMALFWSHFGAALAAINKLEKTPAAALNEAASAIGGAPSETPRSSGAMLSSKAVAKPGGRASAP